MDVRNVRQSYENVPGNRVTLSELKEINGIKYPVIGHWITEEGTEEAGILLEKPKSVLFARVRVGNEKMRNVEPKTFANRNIGTEKEILIPVNYPGKIKIVETHRRYVSIEQVIEDPPRFIRIQQQMEYNAPNRSGPKTKIGVGTILEVKGLYSPFGLSNKYLECSVEKNIYWLEANQPINCISVDDTNEYTLSELDRSLMLPKTVQFQTVRPEDVLLEDDDRARTLLTMLKTPVVILDVMRMNVFVAWTPIKLGSSRSVALIPENKWDDHVIEIKTAGNIATKVYTEEQFGKMLDSSFVDSGLYSLQSYQADIVWLLEPREPVSRTQVWRYENMTPRDVPTYYGKLDEAAFRNTYLEPLTLASSFRVEGESEQTKIPDLEETEQTAERKPKREALGILQMAKEKIRIGFGKVHDELLKRVKRDDTPNLQEKEYQIARRPTRLPSKSRELAQDDNHNRIQNIDFSPQNGSDKGSNQPPVSGVTIGLKSPMSSNPESLVQSFDDKTNITDEDKVHAYEYVNVDIEETTVTSPTTLARSDTENTVHASCDFYQYTVEELVKCFKTCGLDKLAKTCKKNKLDGAFFKMRDSSRLSEKPFCLNTLDCEKVRKIIEEGWRPKV